MLRIAKQNQDSGRHNNYGDDYLCYTTLLSARGILMVACDKVLDTQLVRLHTTLTLLFAGRSCMRMKTQTECE